MKTLKICLGILCLLPVLAIGTPQSIGAKLFMKTIIIKSEKHGDKVCFVDDEDYNIVSKYRWVVEKGRTTFYALHSSGWHKNKGITIRMHQLILGVEQRRDGKRSSPIDHKDHNGLNNQKQNISIVTNSHNAHNRRMDRGQKLVHYKGVTIKRYNKKKYCARIRFNNELIHLGMFSRADEAAIAYNNAALKYFGKSAYLNEVQCAIFS